MFLSVFRGCETRLWVVAKILEAWNKNDLWPPADESQISSVHQPFLPLPSVFQRDNIHIPRCVSYITQDVLLLHWLSQLSITCYGSAVCKLLTWRHSSSRMLSIDWQTEQSSVCLLWYQSSIVNLSWWHVKVRPQAALCCPLDYLGLSEWSIEARLTWTDCRAAARHRSAERIMTDRTERMDEMGDRERTIRRVVLKSEKERKTRRTVVHRLENKLIFSVFRIPRVAAKYKRET